MHRLQRGYRSRREKNRVERENREAEKCIKSSSEKLQSIEEKERYETEEVVKPSFNDLQGIEKKMENGADLNEHDFRMLYAGVLNPENKPKNRNEKELISNLLEKRKSERRQDLALVFNTTEDRISFTEEEALSGGIMCHDGSLNLYGVTSAEGLKLPKNIIGDLNLRGLRTVNGLELPGTIGGDLYFRSFKTAKGLKLPETIGGDLHFRGLTTTEGLELPKTIGGSLYIDRITVAEGLKLPKTIGGSLFLNRLKATEGLELPDVVGVLELNILTNLNGITRWPSYIQGYLCVSNNLSQKDKAFLENKYPGRVKYWKW